MMFTWSFAETVETSASAAQIWALWSQPATWPSWDDSVEWVNSDGPFLAGTRGVMKPVGGPKVKFQLLEAIPGSGFTDRSFLPLTTLDFIHLYTPPKGPNQKATITHRVEMKGLLTPIFARVIGAGVRKGLKAAMTKLAGLAESRE